MALTTWLVAWNAFWAAMSATSSLFSLTPEMDDRLLAAVWACALDIVEKALALDA